MNNIIKEKKFISDRIGIPYSNLSQSYLRSDITLGSQSSYKFELQKNNVATPNGFERLLNLNDEFVITHMALALYADGNTPNQGQAQLSLCEFTDTAPSGVAIVTNGMAVYNSSLSITIDRKEYLPNFDTRWFYRAPQSVDATSYPAAGPGIPGPLTVTGMDWLNSLYGYCPFEPVKIDGRQTIDIDLNIGAGVTIESSVLGGTPCNAALLVRGYLVVNAKS